MVVDAGGKAVHIGILTAIMLGGSSFTQLIFAPFISNYSYKKVFLLLGINSRITALFVLGLFLYYSDLLEGDYKIVSIFLLITVFSLGGAFANISYTDILGKSLLSESRKAFFSTRQLITGIILLGSAFAAKYLLAAKEYPTNYAFMFFVGFLALAIASLGFWKLKEVVPSHMQVKNPVHFYRLIKQELRQNDKLKYFLGFINTMGVSISFLPFVILFAKDFFELQSESTGNYLLFKVIGGVFTGLLLLSLRGKYKYRHLLFLNVGLALFLPIIMILFFDNPPFYLIFLLGGIVFATYTITMNGVLLEVSGTSNRALYAGIAGSGNILPALFPLLGGWIIKAYGFQPFLILFMVIISSALFFIYKIRCKN